MIYAIVALALAHICIFCSSGDGGITLSVNEFAWRSRRLIKRPWAAAEHDLFLGRHLLITVAYLEVRTNP